jgi:D-3-phosphoglycerate dehydrogenase / 2-oxoglutarate reductase
MGMLHAQMDRGTVKGATLRYRGEVASKNTRLITASFAAGWMEAALDSPVNLVNAEVLLKERGIAIVEEKSTEPGDFGSMIQTEVTTERKTYIASATLFGKQYLRLVQLGPYRLDAHLDGTLLVFTHRDMPGLIGFIGTTFGRHGVNIAQMNVGREQPGGEAIGVVNLDSYPPKEAIAEIESHKEILSLSVIRLPALGEVPPWLGS